jgi:IS30 family transposase
MGRKGQLTEYEGGQIDAYAAQGVSASQIAAAIGRSRKPIYNYLRDPASYEKRFGRAARGR